MKKNVNSNIWIVDLIITDNEADSVQSALQQKGLDVKISKQIHWEINCSENPKNVFKANRRFWRTL